MESLSKIVLEIFGRQSPWANQPHEGIWREQIAQQSREVIPKPFDASIRPVRATVEFRMIAARRGDLDNLAKPVLDTLFRQSRKSVFPVASVFLCDDCHLHELSLKRVAVASVEEEGAVITIEVENV